MTEYLSTSEIILRDYLKRVDLRAMREQTQKSYQTLKEELRVEAIRDAIDAAESMDDIRAILHAVVKTTT